MSTAAASRRFPWLLTLASLVALAILLALGTWQVQRLAWKEALIATIDSRVHMPPVPLDEALSTDRPIADDEYRPVLVEGVFVHGSERHFFATHDGASGFFVYTPLQRDGGDYVFVNRGFVPFDRKDPTTRAAGQVQGRVAVSGLLRSAPAEKPSSLLPDNEPARNIFYWKDIRDMAATAGLPADAKILGLFVDAGDAPNPGELPVGGVTILELPNNHFGYAVTWYGLAVALVGVYLTWMLRWRQTAARP